MKIIEICCWFYTYLGNIIMASGVIISATIAAFIAVKGYKETRKTEVEKLVEENLRKRKIELYDDFATFAGEQIYNLTNNKKDDAFDKKMFIYNHRAMIWMSDSVLKKYIAFRNTSSTEKPDVAKTKDIIYAYIEYMNEMRKDSGHENIGIKNEDLLRLITKDKI